MEAMERIKELEKENERLTKQVLAEREAIRYISDNYGVLHQCGKAEEEAAELIVALKNYQKAIELGKDTKECLGAIADEVADVTLMLEEIKYLLLKDFDIIGIVDYKIKRQLRRIEHGE